MKWALHFNEMDAIRGMDVIKWYMLSTQIHTLPKSRVNWPKQSSVLMISSQSGAVWANYKPQSASSSFSIIQLSLQPPTSSRTARISYFYALGTNSRTNIRFICWIPTTQNSIAQKIHHYYGIKLSLMKKKSKQTNADRKRTLKMDFFAEKIDFDVSSVYLGGIGLCVCAFFAPSHVNEWLHNAFATAYCQSL